MNILKFIVKNILKAIDEIIDFINYIFNFKLSHLPKFTQEIKEYEKELNNE